MIRFSLAAAVLLSTASSALPAGAGAWGGIFSAVTLTSDYRYQGVSSSENHAAVQGYVHYWRPDGWNAGLFATQVDFNDYGTSYELDIYGGRNIRLDGKTELKLQGMVTTFPDNRTPGPTYDFVQATAAVTRREGPLTVVGTTSYVPAASYGSGQAWRFEAEGAYAVRPGLVLKALAGRRWIERGSDRTYWSLGATATWRHLTVDLRYQDTNLSRAQCGYNPDICGPALVGAVTATLPPIL